MKKSLYLFIVIFYPFSFFQLIASEISHESKETVYVKSADDFDIFYSDKVYIIEKDISIHQDSTLEIQPGTLIRLKNSVRINVYGKLIAKGKEDSLIVFTSFDDNPWNCINFQNSYINEVEYCSFENTLKRDARSGALYFGYFSRLRVIKNCEFFNNNSGSVFISNFQNEHDKISFINNSILDSEDFGISIFGGSFNELIFSNNKIQGKIYSFEQENRIGFTGIRIGEIFANRLTFEGNKIERASFYYDIEKRVFNHPGGAILIQPSIPEHIKNIYIKRDTLNNNQSKFSALTAICKNSIVIDNALIENNSSVSGGGYLKCNKLEVYNTVFKQNKNIDSKYSPDAGGGGLTIKTIGENPNIQINHSVFKENRFQLGNGGGLIINGENRDCNVVSIIESSFEGNIADENGGAIYCSNFHSLNDFIVESSSFLNNIADVGNIGGGGILLESIHSLQRVQITNSNQIKNNITNYGHGGFINFNGINTIRKFNYINNLHDGLSNSVRGFGGLIYLKSDLIDSFHFNENIGISAKAKKSGGTIFLDNHIVNDILELTQNKVDSTVCYEGDGGFLAIANDSINKLLFDSNQLTYSHTLGSGGVLYIHTKYTDDLSCNLNSVKQSNANDGMGGAFYFNFTKCNQILTNNNIFENSYSKGPGGTFYIQVDDSLGIFDHRGNNVNLSESEHDGGVLFLNSIFKRNEGKLNIINNKSERTISHQNGGYAYISGYYNNDLYFTHNNIIESVAYKNGGILFFNLDNDCQLDTIVFTDNVIQKSSRAKNGNGGVLHFNGMINELLNITNNIIGDCSSGRDGGGFYILNKGIRKFSFTFDKNTIENAKSGKSGGMVYLFGNKIGFLDFNYNKLSGSSLANNNGGSFHLNISHINDLVFHSNDISSSIATNGNGGFCNVNSSSIDNLTLTENTFGGEYLAKDFGGIFFTKSLISKNILISENNFSGEISATNGGLFAFESMIPNADGTTLIDYNSCNADINVTNDGGAYYFNGGINSDFIFSRNLFESNSKVGKNGGLIYIYNNNGNNSLFNFNDNSVFSEGENISVKAGNGGFLFFEGSFQTQKINLENNTILPDSMSVDSMGGVFYINNHSNFKISEINISNNQFANIQVPVNGIIGSFNCKVDSLFSFVQNNLSDFSSNTINNSNSYADGTLYINNFNETGLLNLKVNQNEVQNINYNNSPDNLMNQNGGGLIKYAGNFINNAEIKSNKVSDVKSGFTGIVTLNVDSINSLISSNNNFNNIDAGVGSIYYLTGENRVTLKTFETNQDIVKNTASQKEASYIFINASNVNFFEVNEADMFNCYAGGAGGGISFSNEIVIDSLVIKNSIFSNVSAYESGGLINSTGDINDFLFTNNNITNYSAGGHGGVISLSVIQKDTVPCILRIDNSNFIIKEDTVSGWEFINGNQKWTTEGEGGSIYLKSVDEINLLNNYFDHSVSLQSGGGIRSIGSQKFNLTNCEFVYNKSVNNNGGAIALTNFGLFEARKNKINSNFAPQGNGGGYYLDNGFIKITNDSIVYCSAQNGAGIYADMFAGAIDSTCFVRNKAPEVPYILPYKGGALFLSHINSDESFKLSDNKFYRNSSERGGALFLDSSKVISTRQIFAFNRALDKGGAVYLNENSTSSEFFNNIFEFNEVEEEPEILDKAAGIQVYAGQKSDDTTKIINCLFLNNYGLAVSITDNSFANTKARCLIRNSELYFNKYFSEDHIQFYDPIDILLVDYSNVQNIDSNIYPATYSISPYYNPSGTICLDENSANKNKGHPGSRYFDICDTTNLRNDVGVTGGPYAFCNCELIKIENNNCCITNSELFSNTSGQQIKVYPNPTNGILKLELLPNFDKSYTVKIFGLDGIMYFEKKITNIVSRQVISFNIDELPNGTYLIKVFNTKNSYTSKIVKL